MNEVKLLKIPEVCDRLQLGKTKVYELIGGGELGHVKIGTAVRVPSTEVDDYIRRQIAEQIGSRQREGTSVPPVR